MGDCLPVLGMARRAQRMHGFVVENDGSRRCHRATAACASAQSNTSSASACGCDFTTVAAARPPAGFRALGAFVGAPTWTASASTWRSLSLSGIASTSALGSARERSVEVDDPAIDRVRVEVGPASEVANDFVDDLGGPVRSEETPGRHGGQEVGDLDPVQHVGVEHDDEPCHLRRRLYASYRPSSSASAVIAASASDASASMRSR